MIQKIINDIQSHYKDTVISKSDLSGDCLTLEMSTRFAKYPYIAKRILDKNKSVRIVIFTGGWVEGAYTRESLRMAGYKMK